jgi:hypothetical protein
MKRILLLCCIALCACTQKSFEDKDSLVSYLRDESNGYFIKKNVQGFDFSMFYRPTDLMVFQELSDKLSGSEKQAKLKELREKYQKHIYLSLSISKDNQELLSVAPSNKQEFGSLVNQLAFDMDKKVHLFNSRKDTVEMIHYAYPRLYGMGKSTDLLLVYPRDTEFLKEETLTMTIEDLGIYTGEIKFKIDTEKILSEPNLNFN